MTHSAALHPAVALLARETAAHGGTVPDRLGQVTVNPGHSALVGDEFLLRTDSGFGFHYRPGQGVTVASPPGGDPGEGALWLNGSVYAAVASINGFLPIHASAVAWNGQVHAFTGPSGAGKSTLVAALGTQGLPLFCDDTLVLDITDPGRILCLPGHKRLKLTDEALRLTGAMAQEQVGAMTGKSYAQPPGGTLRDVLPLAQLTFLEDGAALDVLPVAGAQRLARLNDDHYTADLFALARGAALADRFALLARLAPRIAMSRLIRPRDPAQFDASVARAAQMVRDFAA